ncbi:MAG: hypothetical protein AB1492_01715 [Bacillota bacterium]
MTDLVGLTLAEALEECRRLGVEVGTVQWTYPGDRRPAGTARVLRVDSPATGPVTLVVARASSRTEPG